jgi:hypothetical protein
MKWVQIRSECSIQLVKRFECDLRMWIIPFRRGPLSCCLLGPRFDVVEMFGPELFELIDPTGRRLQRLRNQSQVKLPTELGASEQPSLFEHPNVLRYRHKRHRKRGRQRRNGYAALRQSRHNRPPRRVRQGEKQPIQRRWRILNHLVKFMRLGRRRQVVAKKSGMQDKSIAIRASGIAFWIGILLAKKIG